MVGVWLFLPSCGGPPTPLRSDEDLRPVDTTRFQLVARLVHVTDTHIVDEESPARLSSLGDLSRSAWRPNEAYSTQILDGVVRTINKWHAARAPIDFVVVTGDVLDNMQRNELRWFITCFDGGVIDPRSGPDDRAPENRSEPLLDPHHPFTAQGLYQHGFHGDLASVDWYAVMGNHDHFALGVFPVISDFLGRRVAPLPLRPRLGLFLPLFLDPLSALAFSPITPAFPVPRPGYLFSQPIHPNAERAFITNDELVRAHVASRSSPAGHGFDSRAVRRTWYSISPKPGVRLIALNSSTPVVEQPTQVHSEGAISLEQLHFLEAELSQAESNNEVVILATHHPATSLQWQLGTALTAPSMIALLQRHPKVKLHLAGHWHVNAVLDRDTYYEIVTGSTLDSPQLTRVIELWRNGEEIEVRYRYLSHLEDIPPPNATQGELFLDPLLPMRRIAHEMAVPNPT